jgi:hypothetical protein
MQLIRSIEQKVELLKSNPTIGNNIPKNLIPKNLGVSNLFRLPLSGYFRMLYSLEGNQVEIIAFFLYILDHKNYNKLFGYKKK